jgi:hypothetical protein
VIHVSLRDWLVTGELGPFTLGATKAQLLRTVGPPSASGCPDLGEDMVWRYGDIELLFLATRPPFRVYSVSIHAFNERPDGGRHVRIDPWVIRTSMPPARLRGALAGIGVQYREELSSHDDTALHMIVREQPRIDIHFITKEREDYPPICLHGIWSVQKD